MKVLRMWTDRITRGGSLRLPLIIAFVVAVTGGLGACLSAKGEWELGLAVAIARGSWPVLPVFDVLQRLGRVPEDDMYRTFNMGIGFVLIALLLLVAEPGGPRAVQTTPLEVR